MSGVSEVSGKNASSSSYGGPLSLVVYSLVQASDKSCRSVPCNRAKLNHFARLLLMFEIQDFTIRAPILNFTSSKIEQIFKVSPQARPRNYVYLNDGMDFPSFSALNGCHHIRSVSPQGLRRDMQLVLIGRPTVNVDANGITAPEKRNPNTGRFFQQELRNQC